MKRDRKRVLGINLVLFAVLFGLINLQAFMIAKDLSKTTLWEATWWFGVYFAIAFGGNLVAFGKHDLGKRLGLSSVATVALAVVWLGSLAFCGHVLGLQY